MDTSQSTPSLHAARMLADLAVEHPAASRVFHRHGLDFCCHGRVSLQAACLKAGLDPAVVLAELEAATAGAGEGASLALLPSPALIEHILQRFHADHREELPRLAEMARRVERVHADKPACPAGLAAYLDEVAESLDEHMQKEEQVLFPMILAGRGRQAAMPISVMEDEHRDHGIHLAKLRKLGHGYVAPEDACSTWRALYMGLFELERLLMEHIHLENNVLFPRALRG
ncbi:MAG: iron-sulfur cluster repair protein YtfE [Planctomycetota bacterium]